MSTIQIVLTSTVIAGICSSIISFFINKKNSDLQYITKEREIWRNEIRNISVEISSMDKSNVTLVLNKLKLRINAYGILGAQVDVRDNFKNSDVNNDAHIWNVINELEDINISDEVFQLKKTLLIQYISLLLKKDWERSKIEVKGSKINFFKWVCFITSLLLYSYLYFIIWEIKMGLDYTIGIFVLVACVFIKTNFTKILENEKVDDRKGINKKIFIRTAIYLVFYIALFVYLAFLNKVHILEYIAEVLLLSMITFITIYYDVIELYINSLDDRIYCITISVVKHRNHNLLLQNELENKRIILNKLIKVKEEIKRNKKRKK
jgi:hypothetical protein